MGVSVKVFLLILVVIVSVLLALLAPSIMNNIDPAGPSLAEVEGIYVIQNIPMNSEGFIGGEYISIDSNCHDDEGCDLTIRPDTHDPKCAPELPLCSPEAGRWFLEGDQLILTVESVSIVGRVDGDIIIFEKDPCGDREDSARLAFSSELSS